MRGVRDARTKILVTVLLNPASGRAGKPGVREHIAELFLAAGVDAQIIVLREGQDPTEAAHVASAHASTVVAAGGDGTVRLVASGLVGTPAVLGVLPLGTFNHFARDLHLPLDLERAVATIATHRVGRVDVGRVNDYVFLNNSSIGIYPSIIETREQLRRQGYRKWPAFVLATVRILRHYRGVVVKIEADGRQAVYRTPFVFVGNNEYEVDGIGLGRRAALDGGLLFVYLTPRVRTRDLPKLLAKALLGRVRRSGAFEIVSATELWIDTPTARRIRVALDGEIVMMTRPLHFRTVPRALGVVIPPA